MSEKKKTRALDIALKAGVSTSTVDRVLNARGRVSAKTVDLVMKTQSALENDDCLPSGSTTKIEVYCRKTPVTQRDIWQRFFKSLARKTACRSG